MLFCAQKLSFYLKKQLIYEYLAIKWLYERRPSHRTFPTPSSSNTSRIFLSSSSAYNTDPGRYCIICI